MSNSDNTTGLMSGGMESWKMMTALFQMMLCVGSDGDILPHYRYASDIRDVTGFQDICMLDWSDIVLSAAASCLEMYLAITSKVLRVGDIPTVQYLVDCAVFHHVRLSRLFKSLQMSTTEKKKKRSSDGKRLRLVPWDEAVGGNKCHLLRQHVVESKLWMGANPRQIDTELSEGFHKETVKKVFAQSSKRHGKRQFEMATILSRQRVLTHLLTTVHLERVSGKRNRESLKQGGMASPATAERQYKFASESTPFAKFDRLTPDDGDDTPGQDLYLPEKDRIRFFHPCISEEILHSSVSSFYASHHSLPDMQDVEVFAIQSVKIADAGQAEWKALCKPAKVMCEDDHYDDREQIFSGAFCNIGDSETFVRILGIVLFTGKEQQDDGHLETANYYTAFVQPFEQREGRESARTYLPFPVMYPEFGDRDDEGPGRRALQMFQYYFADMDGLLGPSAVIRMPESICRRNAKGEVLNVDILESASMFRYQESVPPFLVIDLRRFDWPKDESWNASSYATDLVNHPNAVVRVIDLYPPPSTLSEMQVKFGLEDEGPEADAAADSLDAFESSDDDDDNEDREINDHDDDREIFDFLLADA